MVAYAHDVVASMFIHTSLPSLPIGEHILSILSASAATAGVDSEWAYVCDLKVAMNGKSAEIKTLMFFADSKCEHLDFSWIAKERAEAAALVVAAEAAAISLAALTLGEIRATETQPEVQGEARVGIYYRYGGTW